jgi:hypothetical protein
MFRCHRKMVPGVTISRIAARWVDPTPSSSTGDTGTAYLLPRLLRLPDGTSRTSGPLFLAARKPVPVRPPRSVRSLPSRRCPRSEPGPASPGLDDYSPMAHMAAILI